MHIERTSKEKTKGTSKSLCMRKTNYCSQRTKKYTETFPFEKTFIKIV